MIRPSGRRIWFSNEYGKHGYWTENWAGNLPLFEHGVRLETRHNDGSKDYKDLIARLNDGPVWE